MNFRSKRVTLCLITMLITLCVLLVEPCVAPIAIPTNPTSGPEIDSVVIYNAPIWTVPNVIDPYTGVFVTTEPGFWTQNGTVEVTIKNRSFSQYADENGNNINTYYSIFYKTKDSSEWIGMPLGVRGVVPIAVYQSDSAYTVIDFNYGTPPPISAYRRYFGFYSGDISFRIQTVEQGCFSYSDIPIFEGVGSEWTEFTITIPPHDPYTNLSGTSKPNIHQTFITPSTSDPYSLPISNPYIPPQQSPWSSNLFIIALVAICIIISPLVIIAYLYRQRKKMSHTLTA